jgi:hypothetical protein
MNPYYWLWLFFGAACLGGEDNLWAQTNPPAGYYVRVLKSAPLAELPARAAELISQAKTNALEDATFEVVKAAVARAPAAAPAVVGWIAKTTPAMAGTAAATAVTLVPQLLVYIARAAAAEAPSRAGEVVAALTRLAPWNYHDIALGVAKFAPGHEAGIVAGLRTAIPEVGIIMDQNQPKLDANAPNLTVVLDAIARRGLHVKLPANGPDLQLSNLAETRAALQQPLTVMPTIFDPYSTYTILQSPIFYSPYNPAEP